jgi:hypothetical protein
MFAAEKRFTVLTRTLLSALFVEKSYQDEKHES